MKANLIILVLLSLICSSCSVTRVSTSKRTAVEQALLTQTTKYAVNTLDLTTYKGKSFFIESNDLQKINCFSDYCESPDLPYLLSSLMDRLVTNGLLLSQTKEKADLIVYPRIDFALLDDSESLIGIPTIPIPVPTVGTVETPELAIFGNITQYGRVKFSVTGVERESGALSFSESTAASEKRYSRWVFLFFISWRTTNLDAPF